MSRILQKSFRYTPVADQGPGYLQRKFDRLRREQQANAKEAQIKVAPIKKTRTA